MLSFLFALIWWAAALIGLVLVGYEIGLASQCATSCLWLGLPIRRRALKIPYGKLRQKLGQAVDIAVRDVDASRCVVCRDDGSQTFVRAIVSATQGGTSVVVKSPLGFALLFSSFLLAFVAGGVFVEKGKVFGLEDVVVARIVFISMSTAIIGGMWLLSYLCAAADGDGILDILTGDSASLHSVRPEDVEHTSENRTVLKTTSADDAWLLVPAFGICTAVSGYAAYRGTVGDPLLGDGLSGLVLSFSMFGAMGLGFTSKLVQFLRPTVFRTIITDSDLRCTRSDRDEDVFRVAREFAVSIHPKPRRWYHDKRTDRGLEILCRDGDVIDIKRWFVSFANRQTFVSAIRQQWGQGYYRHAPPGHVDVAA